MRRYTTELGPVTFLERGDADRAAWDLIRARGPLSVDTEATGFKPYAVDFKVRLMQAGSPAEAFTWDPREFPQLSRAAVTTRPHGGVNVMFDLKALDRDLGITLEETLPYAVDLGIVSRVLDCRGKAQGQEYGHTLDDLLNRYLGLNTKVEAKAELKQHAKRTYGLGDPEFWAGTPLEDHIYQIYAGMDVLGGARLAEVMLRMVQERGLAWLVEWEHRGAGVTSMVTRHGILLDKPYAEKAREEFHRQSMAHEDTLANAFGLPRVKASGKCSTSKEPLVEKFRGMGVKLTKLTDTGVKELRQGKIHRTADGGVSDPTKLALDKDVLTKIVIEYGANSEPGRMADTIRLAKKAHHYGETYMKSFIESIGFDGRVHSSINTLGAATGRWSMTDPALQQVPKDEQVVRGAFIADPGYGIVTCDYDAVEVRIMAAISGDENLWEVILSGGDPHGIVAAALYGPNFTKAQRDVAKGCLFGKAYGGGLETISLQVGVKEETVSKVLAMIAKQYPKIMKRMRDVTRALGEKGGTFLTATGRPVTVDKGYVGFNYDTQGPARDVYMDSTITMADNGLLPYMLLPVHDEWVNQFPLDQMEELSRELKRHMSNEFLGMPITATPELLGERWRK